MHRFSPVLGPLAVLALSLPAVAFAQAGQGSGGHAPASPAAPPATESIGAPASPPPATTAQPAPPPASGASGGAAPATPGGATIDRSSLLPPSPTARGGSPAEPRDGDRKDNERKVDTSIGANPKAVYAEDWWVHSRPVFEMHGILRVRAELLHNFSLGRIDDPRWAVWPQPIDNSYATFRVPLCGDNPQAPANCENKSQAGANMRFRINPELHISDNLRVMSQIDMLDNLVLGSTPGGYNGQQNVAPGGVLAIPPPTSAYLPVGAFSNTQVAPASGFNNFQNSINIRRAWGEYATPVGQLRFGRMPNHWGMGMVENSGDTYDSDWQSTVDRIMFTTGIRPLDLYISGAWDFPNEGPTSASREATVGGQPYDLGQLDDTNQYTGMIARRRNPELQKADLARGELVLNGGVYFQYRDQLLAFENPPLGASTYDLQQATTGRSYVRRGLKLYTPDIWFQLLYKKFRFEIEGAMMAGSLNTTSALGGGAAADILQFGLTTQTEWRAVEDRLRLQFGFGWSSGDGGLYPDDPNRTSSQSPSRPTNTAAGSIYGPRVIGSRKYTQFRFHPDYRVDLILHRNILGRVQGDYYFRPSIEYDFTRSAEGQKLGGGAAVIWTRASEFMQTPGHKRDLGIEINLALYYQSKDGSLNDNPDKMGGFFTSLQYGVLFPMGGLNYLPNEPLLSGVETSAAHTLRWFMGIMF
jgi:uncharacterized protein (TIGR04551 family)